MVAESNIQCKSQTRCSVWALDGVRYMHKYTRTTGRTVFKHRQRIHVSIVRSGRRSARVCDSGRRRVSKTGDRGHLDASGVPFGPSPVQLGYSYVPNSGEWRACVVVVPPHLSLGDVVVDVLSPSRVSMFRTMPVFTRAQRPPFFLVCCCVFALCAIVYGIYSSVAYELQSVDTGPP